MFFNSTFIEQEPSSGAGWVNIGDVTEIHLVFEYSAPHHYGFVFGSVALNDLSITELRFNLLSYVELAGHS